ncbi:hypothetical protein [Methanocalculus alkaliphilus]
MASVREMSIRHGLPSTLHLCGPGAAGSGMGITLCTAGKRSRL